MIKKIVVTYETNTQAEITDALDSIGKYGACSTILEKIAKYINNNIDSKECGEERRVELVLIRKEIERIINDMGC